jgi:hypothetical protein
VKKTLNWCRITAAIMSVAAHLCSPLMNQPNATSRVMNSTDWYAVEGEAS